MRGVKRKREAGSGRGGGRSGSRRRVDYCILKITEEFEWKTIKQISKF